MTIEFEGQQIEAYSLLMTKENAIAILNGTKKIETRLCSDYYYRMFTDEEKVRANDKAIKEGREEDYQIPMKDIFAIHFHNCGTFTMDVLVEECGVSKITKDCLKELADDFDFHEFDDAAQNYVGQEGDAPMFYWFAIEKVIRSTGLIV